MFLIRRQENRCFLPSGNNTSSTLHVSVTQTQMKRRHDDARRPFQLGMSRTPSYVKSPWIQTVNSFLTGNPFCTPLVGILCNHRPSCIARCDPTSMVARGNAKEAQDSRPSKVYAWKRRKKREAKDDQDDAEDDREGGEKTRKKARKASLKTGSPA